MLLVITHTQADSLKNDRRKVSFLDAQGVERKNVLRGQINATPNLGML